MFKFLSPFSPVLETLYNEVGSAEHELEEALQRPQCTKAWLMQTTVHVRGKTHALLPPATTGTSKDLA